MDGEEVDSISDNVEAMQVAYIIRDTYNDVTARLQLPNKFNFFELVASGDPTKPTLMYLPSNVSSVEFIKYNNVDTSAGESSPKFLDVQFQNIDVFENAMSKLNSDTMTNVQTFSHTISGLGTFDFLCYNDRPPTKYSTWDDYTLVFDSFDADNDTTLVANKTQGYGEISSTFVLSDTYVFPLDNLQYSLLLNEAKSQAFAELKQTQNVVSSQRARRAWVSEQHLKKKNQSKRYQDKDLPDYGWKRN